MENYNPAIDPIQLGSVRDQRITALRSVAVRHIVFLAYVYSLCVCLAYVVQVCLSIELLENSCLLPLQHP